MIHKKLQDLLQIVEQVISPQPQVPAQHEPQMSGVQTWDASPPASTMDQSFAANISNPLAVLANISLRDEESDAHAAIQSLPPEDIHPYDLFLRPQEFYAEGMHVMEHISARRSALMQLARHPSFKARLQSNGMGSSQYWLANSGRICQSS